MAQIYPRTLGSLSVASYDSQGYGEGILSYLHRGITSGFRLFCDRRSVSLGVRHPSGTSDQFFFLLEILFKQFQVCYFVAPSLTRGRVCNLLLLLVLARAVPLKSAKSLKTQL
jgi:hypothetical protein